MERDLLEFPIQLASRLILALDGPVPIYQGSFQLVSETVTIVLNDQFKFDCFQATP